MKKYLKLLLGACLAFSASDLRASIYRIDLSYGNDLSADGAGLSGYGCTWAWNTCLVGRLFSIKCGILKLC